MNCQELTTAISNIKAQLTELDKFVGERKPEEAIEIKKEIKGLFSVELKEYTDTFYKNPTPENYEKEVNRILNKIGDRDPSEVSFSRRQLRFIYDIEDKEWNGEFNTESVSEIKEIRKKRKLKQKEDASIIFNLSSDQIALADDIIAPNTPKEDIDSILKESIAPNTKLYIGPLFTDIFNLPNLEHIYTSFPEIKIRRGKLTIGGKKLKEIESELKEKNIQISKDAELMLHSPDFMTLPKPEQIETVRLKVSDLGFIDNPTTDQLYARAIELGLELCPAEVGPHQRLKNVEQPIDDWYKIAMDPIANRDGGPYVFFLGHSDGGLSGFRFSSSWASPSRKWDLNDETVFCLRSSTRT